MTGTEQNWVPGTQVLGNYLNLGWTDGGVQPGLRAFRVVLGLRVKVFGGGRLQEASVRSC